MKKQFTQDMIPDINEIITKNIKNSIDKITEDLTFYIEVKPYVRLEEDNGDFVLHTTIPFTLKESSLTIEINSNFSISNE